MERDGFFEALRDNPDDHSTRLVLADWYEDHGEPERAEFLRLHATLDQLPGGHPDQKAFLTRQEELRARHELTWLGPRSASLVECHWKGGLLIGLKLSEAATLSELASILCQHPVRHLTVPASLLAGLAQSPLLRHFRSLDIPLVELSVHRDKVALLDRLFSSPHLGPLTDLSIASAGVDNYLARLLAQSPVQGSLRRLALVSHRLDDAGIVALLQPGSFPCLESWKVIAPQATTVSLARLTMPERAARIRSIHWPRTRRARLQDVASLRRCVHLQELFVDLPYREWWCTNTLEFLHPLTELRQLTLGGAVDVQCVDDLVAWPGLATLDALTLLVPGSMPTEQRTDIVRTLTQARPWQPAHKLRIATG